MDPKIVAMYLPQYHSIPENDMFWGKGFTDWISVKKANSLYSGHNQPRIPLDSNYYDLSEKETILWQTSIAKKYGVFGFGIYHYWFSSEKVLLTKPAEIILNNPDIDFPFLFAWDNISWKRTWSKHKGNDWSPISDENSGKKESGPEILIEYKLGSEEEWEKHFQYLLPYFLDSRYIRFNGNPVFIIFHYSETIEKMCSFWDELAKKAGLQGIHYIFKYDELTPIPDKFYNFTYEPIYSGWGGVVKRIKNKVLSSIGKTSLQRYDYDTVWKNIIKNASKKKNDKYYHGAFVGYDDTPRRGRKGKIVCGQSPNKFENYLSRLIQLTKRQEKEFIFITAWNEWGEGAYLEPDEMEGFAYLDAIKEAIEANK